MELAAMEMTEYHWVASTMWAGLQAWRVLKRPCPRLSDLRMTPGSGEQGTGRGATHLGRALLGMEDNGRHRDDPARGPHLDRDRSQLRDRQGDRARPRPPRGHRGPRLPRRRPRGSGPARDRRGVQEPEGLP